MMHSIKSGRFFKDLDNVDVFNIPLEAGKYITAVLEGTEPFCGRAKSKFVFLSDFAAEVVQIAAVTDSHVKALEKLGIKYFTAEHVARQVFKGKWDHQGAWIPSDPKFDLNHYDVCIDVGCDGLIKPSKLARYKSALMKLLPRWDREIVFNGMYLEKDIKLLDQGCLYRPLFHHFALGDAVVVDHKAKKIFYIQSTAQDIADHSVKLSTLEKVMAKLDLLSGGENGDYTLWIIFCADWSRAKTHGSCFTTAVVVPCEIKDERRITGSYSASSNEKSVVMAAGKNVVRFYKHSCIAEDGAVNYDAFKLRGSEKGWRQEFKREDLSQYLSPKELAILKRCHVLIVRCKHLPDDIKYDLY
jgi:hypothetical protein